MASSEKTVITVEATVAAPVQKVWEYWTAPVHIVKWNNASEDWHTTRAENDVRTGGRFSSRMEAKDGSAGFDFSGVYEQVAEYRQMTYAIDDGRRVSVSFSPDGDTTRVQEEFEAEDTHSLEMQKGGWQAILDSFKEYTETH